HIDARALGRGGQHGAQLRAEEDRARVDLVVDELDARGVARESEPPLALIPERDAEHPVQMIEDIEPPLLVAVDDDFRIRARLEYMPETLELAAQLREVVDLAV